VSVWCHTLVGQTPCLQTLLLQGDSASTARGRPARNSGACRWKSPTSCLTVGLCPPPDDALQSTMVNLLRPQAASGAGQAAMDELELQTQEALDGKEITKKIFPFQVHNCVMD